MKTHRHLDTLLDSVRENPPVERLVERDEVMAMLDAGGRASTPAPRRSPRTALVTASLVVGCGLALFGGGMLLGGDDAPAPAQAPIAEAGSDAGALPPGGGRDEAAATTTAPAPSDESTRADGATPTASDLTAPSDRTARSASGASVRAGGASPESDGRRGAPRRSASEPPFFLANKLTVHADGAMELNAPDEKPELPSGGMTITKTQLDSAEAAAIVARDSAGEALDIKRLGYLELTADEAARLGVTVTDDGLELMADDTKDAQIRNSDSDDRISLYGSHKGADLLRSFEGDYNHSIVRFKLEVVREMTRFAPVEVDVDEKPLPIAPIVIVNQRRWDLRNEGSSLIFFRNAPTLASYEGDAVLRTEPLEAFRSATRSITTIDGINRAMSHMLGRLVPVYFRFDDGLIEGTSIRRGADICLWYAPTKEFIEALPHRYRASLESELSAICEVQEKNGSVEEACDRIAGRPSYLELCRVSSGAVNAAMASPNPAHGSTTIGFRLSEPRSVMVTLHDVNGRYLRHLLHEEERGAGEQSVAADLDGVGQGAYLVAVRTDRGEQAVARLIVQ
jgi:hypothetical protein